MIWWENIVKPGIKKLALKRGRDIFKARHEELNLLRLRQSFLHRKLIGGQTWRLPEIKSINSSINMWYQRESQKVKFQSQVYEFQQNERNLRFLVSEELSNDVNRLNSDQL